MEQPPPDQQDPRFQPPPFQQPNYQQPPFQQPPYMYPPYMQPPFMPYDPSLKAKAIRGNILMFGLVGFGLVIVAYFVAALTGSEILSVCSFLGVPILVGLLAGNAAINGRLAESSAQAALQAASSAGFTALLFATICGGCTVLGTIVAADAMSQSGGSLNDLFEQADVSAAMLMLICLGFWVVGILIYAALGAIGGVVAGLLKRV